MAGWDVAVLVADEVDDRPLRILGAEVENLSTALASGRGLSSAPALAVAIEVLVNSEPVRRHVVAALNGKSTDILLWGARCPTELKPDFTRVGHRPSAAARVFKTYALAAAGTSSPAEMVEEGFFSAT